MSSRRNRLLISTLFYSLTMLLFCACGRETELPRWSFGVEGVGIKRFFIF